MFKRERLPWTSTTNNSCPFDDLCLGPALYLDTGLIDSRDDLGINGHDSDRVQWRNNLTCVPITTDGYSKQGTSSYNYLGDFSSGNITFNYTALLYGPPDDNFLLYGVEDLTLQNATYLYTNFMDLAVPSHGSEGLVPYYLM